MRFSGLEALVCLGTIGLESRSSLKISTEVWEAQKEAGEAGHGEFYRVTWTYLSVFSKDLRKTKQRPAQPAEQPAVEEDPGIVVCGCCQLLQTIHACFRRLQDAPLRRSADGELGLPVWPDVTDRWRQLDLQFPSSCSDKESK